MIPQGTTTQEKQTLMEGIQIVIFVLATYFTLVYSAHDTPGCIRKRHDGGCSDESLLISANSTRHSLDACADLCRHNLGCKDFAIGVSSFNEDFCYLYRQGCFKKDDASKVMYSTRGCERCKHRKFNGGCLNHVDIFVDPFFNLPPQSADECEDKCRILKTCVEFSWGNSPLTSGLCYLYAGNCTNDGNINFDVYTLDPCPFVRRDELRCTEHGMAFSYYNSHNIPYLNLLTVGGADTDPLLRHRKSDDPTISKCSNALVNDFPFYNFTLNYDDCQDAVQLIQEGNHTLIRRAVFEVQENEDGNNYVLRHFNNVLQFNLECHYNMSVDIYGGTFNTTIFATVQTRNMNKEVTFQVDMNVYDTESFQAISSPPKEVTLNQPIYMEIKPTNDWNQTNQYLVVHDCWASDQVTEEDSNMKYTFLSNQCPVDATFRTLMVTSHMFRFKINAFVLLKLQRNVYLTCSLYVCLEGSQSVECQWRGCGNKRKRRDIHQDRDEGELDSQSSDTPIRARRNTVNTKVRRSDVEKGLALSSQILYVERPTCASLICPLNSRCVDNYPAFCQCSNNYVMNKQTNKCSNERVYEFQVQTVLSWVQEYSDRNSQSSMALTHLYQEKLLHYFRNACELLEINGLKIAKIFRINDTSRGTVAIRRQTTGFKLMLTLRENATIGEVDRKMNNMFSMQSEEMVDHTHVIPTTVIFKPVSEMASKYKGKPTVPIESIGILGIGFVTLLLVFIFIFVRRRKQAINDSKESAERSSNMTSLDRVGTC